MNKDLHDDMLKLVRFKVLFVKREYEEVLAKGDELVSDSMDSTAFTAWKIAQMQSEGRLKDIDDKDKKYLRVYYEVLDRYPRERFKYEEEQIDVLKQIRDKLSGKTNGGPSTGGGKSVAFDDMAKVHEAQKTRLKYLRYGFQLSSDKISDDISKAFTAHKDKGDVKGITLTTAQLKNAFSKGININFDKKALESFPGKWLGTNRSYDLNTGKENEDRATTWHMTWEKGKTKDDEYVQRVVGSKEKHYTSNELPRLSDKKVDLALNVYRKDIGITGWLSMYVEFRLELALISYQFGDNIFLWIGQFMTENFEPTLGENRFWMFLEWIDLKAKPVSYYMYGLQFELDFDKGTAKVVGDDVRKAKFERISK
jgi:hypothetical protein